jgi:hypothetical protein
MPTSGGLGVSGIGRGPTPRHTNVRGETGLCSAAAADRTSRLAAVRFVFTAYALLIAVGLVFYIAIGITNHQ